MTRALVTEIEGIGPIEYIRSSRARRLSISMRPFKNVRVTVPVGLSLVEAERFVLERAGWMLRQRVRLTQLEKEMEEASVQAATIDTEGAKKQLRKRLEELAIRYGFSYSRVTIRNQKTRWGSCSGKNSISLNRQLVLLPDELIDYVLLHELMHTRIKNHSLHFWTELEKILPGARVLAAKLKQHRLAA